MKRSWFILTILFLATACGTEQGTVSSNSGGSGTATYTASSTSSLSTEAVRNRILSTVATAPADSYRPGEVIVKFKAGTVQGQAAGAHAVLGAQVIRELRGVERAELVRLPEGMSVAEAVSLYMEDPLVEYAEPNYKRRLLATFPNDAYFPQQWSLHNEGQTMNAVPDADMDMPEAWDVSTGSRDFVVAVIDTGADYSHPDLGLNIWINTAETPDNGVDDDGNGYIDDTRGWDFPADDNDPLDDHGHGTHVSGIIGALGNNGIGVSGVNWLVRIMVLDAMSPDGYLYDSDIVEATYYAADNGADVINASYGGYAYSQSAYDAIDYARGKGVLFVAAAGNETNNNDLYPMYPASYDLPNIISVAASDQDDQLASFSNYGATTVDVAAPGNHTLSTTPTYFYPLGYDTWEGTSMASPHVAGLAALLMDYYRNFTIYQIKALIETFVDRLPQLSGYVATGGRVNANDAIRSLLTPSGLIASTDEPTYAGLRWTDNATGEDGYIIERKAAGEASFTEIYRGAVGYSGGLARYTDTGVTAGTTYTYRVRAYNSIGESPGYSNEATVTVPLKKKSGGGGGCTVASAPVSPSTAAADIALFVLPVVVFGILRRRSR